MKATLAIVLAIVLCILLLGAFSAGDVLAATECDETAAGSPAMRALSTALSFDPDVTVLTNGDLAPIADADTGWRYFGLEVPCDGTPAKSIQFELSGGTGDADLYVRHGAKPNESNYHRPNGRPYRNGNAETVEIANPECGEWNAAVRAFRPFEDVTLTGTVEAGDQNTVKCLGEETQELPEKVKDMWGEPERREHHQLWHFVSGGGWNRLSPQRQRDLRQRGWEPPDHDQEQLGLDFICMHRQMVGYTQQAYEAIGATCKLEGWSFEEFPWGLDNNTNDRSWPAPPWPGNPPFKRDQSARDMREQVTETFANDDWLRTASLGQVARGIERSFHNWMHMRFATTQPGGDVCATDWLGSTCSSQQNAYFWMLHPMIDTFPQRWARANAGRRVSLYRGGPQIDIPANFASTHPTPATDEEVHAFTSELVFQQHDCWTGPMPGPPQIQGQPLVAMSGAAMTPQMAARNRAQTHSAVELLNADGPVLRDFTINSTRDSILPVYTLMSGVLSPEAKAEIKEHLDTLATPTYWANGVTVRYPAPLSVNQRYVLQILLDSPEDFQNPSASMVPLIKSAIRRVRDLGTSGGVDKGAPVPLVGVSGDHTEAAKAIVAIVKANEAVMQIPEVAEALKP